MAIQETEQLWVKKELAGYRIGLTAQAQDELGTISFVTLPSIGAKLEKGQEFVELEAEKAVSEFASPLTGKVIAINEAALANPTLLDDPTQENAWLVVVDEVVEA